MRRREYFRRIVMFVLASMVILAQAALFGVAWYGYYRELIFEPFWN